MVRFRLDWPPTVNTYWRATKDLRMGVRIYLSDKGREYKERAYFQQAEQRVPKGDPEARYEVLIDCYAPDRRKRDLDNICKVLLDVMEEYGTLPDDCQVDILTLRRRPATKGGYVSINVLEIPPEDSLDP